MNNSLKNISVLKIETNFVIKNRGFKMKIVKA